MESIIFDFFSLQDQYIDKVSLLEFYDYSNNIRIAFWIKALWEVCFWVLSWRYNIVK